MTTLAVSATQGADGAGQAAGAIKNINRTFVLGPGAVVGDQVALLGSTDGGTSYQPLLDKGTKQPVVLTLGKPEAVLDDGCDHYATRRQAKGTGSTLAAVEFDGEASDNPNLEPIRHQIPVAIAASFTAPRPIMSAFVSRFLEIGYYTPDTTIAADPANYVDVDLKVYDAAGVLQGTVGTFTTKNGITANVRLQITLGFTLGEGYSLAWIATKTGTGTLPIGLIEILYH